MRDARSAMGAYDETRLYEELERVTAEACPLATAGDTERLASLLEQRVALVELIQRVGARPDPQSIERILELDREMVPRLVARRARIRVELSHLARARTSLAVYGAASTPSAVFVQRTT